jgi:beta-galactosidase/beta-glucuronidase
MSKNECIVPRPEYPRPQFQRQPWLNLNGQWSFEFDFGCSGEHQGRRRYLSRGFDSLITVLFCPESELSGVGHKDFIPAMWYHRPITVPEAWAGQRVMLNFGAVDYECECYIDGTSVGTHFGGSISFSFDITSRVSPGGTHHLVLRIADDPRSGSQPGGKQSHSFESGGCNYTRTTGIWQTVWMEAVAPAGLRDVQIIGDVDGRRFMVNPRYWRELRGARLRVALKAAGETIAEVTVPAANAGPAVLPIDAPRLWRPGDPFLYDLELRVATAGGEVFDTVESYAGLRKVHIEGNQILLNNEPLYQRLVLDQGFYSDGIWTAPADDAMRRDIELAMGAGFNGARLHQKVFEERFHYWADRLGYLTWGESASCGCDPNSIEGARNFLSEWAEIIVRDRNHPSIIAWTPWNETGTTVFPHRQHARVHRDSYRLCKELDPTRPVNDASGYIHRQTDLWTVHAYEQDAATLARRLTPSPETGVWRNNPTHEVEYTGQPYIVDEYGGIKWIDPRTQPFAENSWGYGEGPKSLRNSCGGWRA